MLRYENDNTAGNDFFETKESKLTVLVDYPKKTSQAMLMWIKT